MLSLATGVTDPRQFSREQRSTISSAVSREVVIRRGHLCARSSLDRSTGNFMILAVYCTTVWPHVASNIVKLRKRTHEVNVFFVWSFEKSGTTLTAIIKLFSEEHVADGKDFAFKRSVFEVYWDLKGGNSNSNRISRILNLSSTNIHNFILHNYIDNIVYIHFYLVIFFLFFLFKVRCYYIFLWIFQHSILLLEM